MARLILHIGTPKTGTTSIQRFLNEEHANVPLELIDSCGGLYGYKFLSVPSFGDNVAPEFEARIPEKYRLSSAHEIDWSAIEAEIREKRHSGRPFFISEEHFYAVYDKDNMAIVELAQRLKALFDQVTILVYIRDQRAYVKSTYSQLVKRGRITQSFGDYVGDTRHLHDLCDYATRLDLWARAFGHSAIQVIPFQKEALVEGNLIVDVLERIGADNPSLRDRAKAFSEKNISPTFLQLELVRYGTKLRLNPKLRRRWLNNRHTRRLSKSGLPDKYDSRILSISARCNAYVNQTYLSDRSIGLPLPATLLP